MLTSEEFKEKAKKFGYILFMGDEIHNLTVDKIDIVDIDRSDPEFDCVFLCCGHCLYRDLMKDPGYKWFFITEKKARELGYVD